jgi:hypothetical protein
MYGNQLNTFLFGLVFYLFVFLLLACSTAARSLTVVPVKFRADRIGNMGQVGISQRFLSQIIKKMEYGKHLAFGIFVYPYLNL